MAPVAAAAAAVAKFLAVGEAGASSIREEAQDHVTALIAVLSVIAQPGNVCYVRNTIPPNCHHAGPVSDPAGNKSTHGR